MNDELDKWESQGVRGHHIEPHPWALIEDIVRESSSKLIGAKASEVAIMNSLTMNVNSMLFSFYRPTETKYKIIIESKSFPSDMVYIKII